MNCSEVEMSLENVKTPEKVFRYWEKGRLGKGEFQFLLLQTLTPENLEEFLRVVPTDVLDELKTIVKNAPTTDEEWTQTISIRSWCGPWNEEIAARLREDERQAGRRYRVGIETFRGSVHQKE
jgi:hypothetical protein